MNTRHVNTEQAWRGVDPISTFPLTRTRDNAIALVRRAAATGEYIDCHCWVFDDIGFVRIIEEVIDAMALPAKIVDFYPTLRNTLEFFVVIEKTSS